MEDMTPTTVPPKWTKKRRMQLLAYIEDCRINKKSFAKTREDYMTALFGTHTSSSAVDWQANRMAKRFGSIGSDLSKRGLELIELKPYVLDQDERKELRAALRELKLPDDIPEPPRASLDDIALVDDITTDPRGGSEDSEYRDEQAMEQYQRYHHGFKTSLPSVTGRTSSGHGQTLARPTPSPFTSFSVGTVNEDSSTIHMTRRVQTLSPMSTHAESFENTRVARSDERSRPLSNQANRISASRTAKKQKLNHGDDSHERAIPAAAIPATRKQTMRRHEQISRIQTVNDAQCSPTSAHAQSGWQIGYGSMDGRALSGQALSQETIHQLEHMLRNYNVVSSSPRSAPERRLKEKAEWFDSLFPVVELEREAPSTFPGRLFLPTLIKEWESLAWETINVRDGQIHQLRGVALVNLPPDFHSFLITIFGTSVPDRFFRGGPMPQLKEGTITLGLLKAYVSYSLCQAVFGIGAFEEDSCNCLSWKILNGHRNLFAATNGLEDLHKHELAVMKRLAITSQDWTNQPMCLKAKAWAARICQSLAVFHIQDAASKNPGNDQEALYQDLFEKMWKLRIELTLSSAEYQLIWNLANEPFDGNKIQGVDHELCPLRGIPSGAALEFCIFPALYQYSRKGMGSSANTTEDVSGALPLNRSFISTTNTLRSDWELAGKAVSLVKMQH